MAELATQFEESGTYKVIYIQCKHACTVLLGFILGLTETKVTCFVLKGNRAEGEQRLGRECPPGCIHRCQVEADQQLAGQLAQQIPTS